jgi:hypothetical protein
MTTHPHNLAHAHADTLSPVVRLASQRILHFHPLFFLPTWCPRSCHPQTQKNAPSANSTHQRLREPLPGR